MAHIAFTCSKVSTVTKGPWPTYSLSAPRSLLSPRVHGPHTVYLHQGLYCYQGFMAHIQFTCSKVSTVTKGPWPTYSLPAPRSLLSPRVHGPHTVYLLQGLYCHQGFMAYIQYLLQGLYSFRGKGSSNGLWYRWVQSCFHGKGSSNCGCGIDGHHLVFILF